MAKMTNLTNGEILVKDGAEITIDGKNDKPKHHKVWANYSELQNSD